MQNFFYSIPTKVEFGKGAVARLPEFVKEFGDRVLIVYGGGSIKRSGLYDTVVKLLDDHGIYHIELSGVEPNPRVTTANRGVKICREENIDVILPIGGGSTIDCAKAIAAGYYYDGDVWDMVLDNSLITDALPLITILTLAATGSEMDIFSVISNMETNEKLGLDGYVLYPKYSILDPEYTYSVPKYQTASGTADIMSHIFEVYFNGVEGTYMQERVMEGLLKTCVHYGPIACEKPDDYDARANLMWTASWAINGFISCGKSGPWPCHAMEHQLSAYYDVTHGHGLAILTPVWMEYILNDKTVDLFVNYGISVFGISPELDKMEIAKQAIRKTREVFETMGLSSTLRSIGITDKEKFEVMAEQAVAGGTEQCFVPLSKEDVMKIYELCF
ncbi:MAG: iron-containing alcohol dehydrogenase [Lachnospiraceae bacterium]|nr:iron-containing alcohol dehydrogenase [Lachnospiraceae bacterium]